jgi:hypothetical protein
MINKYKVQEKKISIEEQHMSLKLRFETMQYRQKLENLGVSDAEIDQQFPLLPVAAATAPLADSLITPTSTRNIRDAIELADSTEDSDDSSSSSETRLN